MKALDVNVVLVRLNKIEDYINRLEKYQNITLEEYLNSQDIQMITERIIQIITEAALDINKYILSCNG
ncbi:HepT-like ribonuclease domain-containing protein, partial [Crocosphaera watsonii]